MKILIIEDNHDDFLKVLTELNKVIQEQKIKDVAIININESYYKHILKTLLQDNITKVATEHFNKAIGKNET